MHNKIRYIKLIEKKIIIHLIFSFFIMYSQSLVELTRSNNQKGFGSACTRLSAKASKAALCCTGFLRVQSKKLCKIKNSCCCFLSFTQKNRYVNLGNPTLKYLNVHICKTDFCKCNGFRKWRHHHMNDPEMSPTN